MQANGFKRVARTRLPGRGELAHNLSRDGRRASLTLDGLVLEVGPPGRIRGRYRALSQELTGPTIGGRPSELGRPRQQARPP